MAPEAPAGPGQPSAGPAGTTEPRASGLIEAHSGGTFDVHVQSPEGQIMDEPPSCVRVAEPSRLLVWTDALEPSLCPAPGRS